MARSKSMLAELGIINHSLENCVLIYHLNCDMVDSKAALCLTHRNANMWVVYVRYLTSNKKWYRKYQWYVSYLASDLRKHMNSYHLWINFIWKSKYLLSLGVTGGNLLRICDSICQYFSSYRSEMQRTLGWKLFKLIQSGDQSCLKKWNKWNLVSQRPSAVKRVLQWRPGWPELRSLFW